MRFRPSGFVLVALLASADSSSASVFGGAAAVSTTRET